MTAGLHLIRIEVRRSIGVWLFIPLTVVTVWVAMGEINSTIWLWPETSYALLFSVFLLGPLVGAYSAWAAGRERRHRVEDIVVSLPISEARRKIALWIGTAAWGVGAYLAAVVTLGAVNAIYATWGGPYLSVILAGVAGIVAHSAIGFAIGHWIPGRISAPLAGVILFLAQSLLVYNPSAIQYFTPVPDSTGAVEVFYHPPTGIHLAQVIWLIGISAFVLGICLLPRRRNLTHIGATTCAFLVAASGAALLVAADGRLLRGAEASYTPVCLEREIPICLHPAYESMLPETTELIGSLIEPIAGVPGAPLRAEQRSALDALNDGSDETLTFELRSIARDQSQFAGAGYNQLADIVVRDLLNSEIWGTPDDTPPAGNRAKQVVANWLLSQAGLTLTERVGEHEYALYGFQLDAESESALERFSALDDQERRAWFEEHLVRLQAGELTLEDLL